MIQTFVAIMVICLTKAHIHIGFNAQNNKIISNFQPLAIPDQEFVVIDFCASGNLIFPPRYIINLMSSPRPLLRFKRA
jgi:hypothetical protein